MSVRFIAIVGGSGSGKSTIAYQLIKHHPEEIGFLSFDDYQKNKEDIPLTDGRRNWDVPEAIDFDALVRDMQDLQQGTSITIATKNELDNPEYKSVGRKVILVEPKPIMLIPGYLVLHDPRVREKIDWSVYLDVPHETRMIRRTKFLDPEYEENILIPMHQAYVEPTKQYVDLVLDVSEKGILEIVSIIESHIL